MSKKFKIVFYVSWGVVILIMLINIYLLPDTIKVLKRHKQHHVEIEMMLKIMDILIEQHEERKDKEKSE